mgnify:CR=1 FL=1
MSINKNIIYYFSLIRFGNICIAISCVLMSCFFLESSELILCFQVIFLILTSMSIGNISNDIIDSKIDNINHPNRVLPKKLISKKRAYTYLFINLFLLLLNSIFIPYLAIIFLFSVNLLLLLYNIYFKHLPLIGNIIISLLLSSVFIFSELVFANTVNKLFIPSFFAFTISLIRELIKDLEDIEGDKRNGSRTLPILIGVKNTIMFLSFLVMTLYFAGVYFYFIYSLSIEYLLSIIILVEIPLILSLFLLINNPIKNTFTMVSKIIKCIIVGGVLVLFLANLGI